jgi:hypothetical protein
VGKPEGKRQLVSSRSTREDNIKKDLKGIGWDGVDWIHPAQERDNWRDVDYRVMITAVPKNVFQRGASVIQYGVTPSLCKDVLTTVHIA